MKTISGSLVPKVSLAVMLGALVMLLSGCAASNAGKPGEESEAFQRRLNELERKQDTQNARLNQFLYGMEDSLATWRKSMGGGSSRSGRFDVFSRDEIYFELNEYKLDDGDKAILDEYAQRLAEHADSYLQILGYTDKSGGDFYNQELSNQRAEAAVRYLMRRWDVPLNRIERLGFGEEDQAYPDDTAKSRNRNRRVEIQLRVPANTGNGSSLP